MIARKLGVWHYFICLLVLGLLEFITFKDMIGTSALFGDLGDGRLTNLIAEHWFHFFKGEQTFSDLGIFYPAENTLAYSDMLLGFGVIHSLLRFAGLNIYYAYKYTILTVHFFGALSSFYLLKRVLNTSLFWGLFGAVAFSFSDSMITAFLHTQLAAICFMPTACIFGIRFFQYFESRKKRNTYAFLFISEVVLILYTSWYTAFFVALFAAISVVVGIMVSMIRGIRIRKILFSFLHTVGWDLLWYMLFAVLLVIPFLSLELPIMKMTGGYDYSSIALYMPEPVDVLHVSPDNFLLGGWIRDSALFQGKSHEVTRGFSIVLLLAFAVSFAIQFFENNTTGNQTITKRVSLSIISISIVIELMIMLKFRNGFSLWQYLVAFFPGAKSIRAVGRGMFFMSFPMAMITAVMMNDFFREKSVFENQHVNIRYIKRGLGFVILIVLVLSGFNPAVPSYWDSDSSGERIERVAEPPEDCRVFFLSNPACDYIEPILQVDAWEIADNLNLKTINGYSGNSPSGWGDIWNINSEVYQNAVLNWINDKQITDVYEYNQTENEWIQITDHDELINAA